MKPKSKQTPIERAQVNQEVISYLKDLLKDHPLDVIGHIDSRAVCCGNGTVALVKVDRDGYPAPLAPAKKTVTRAEKAPGKATKPSKGNK